MQFARVLAGNFQKNISDFQRAVFGFLLGIILITFTLFFFQQNSFDFENMSRGVESILTGVNPWAQDTRMVDFYNPPFAVIFLWPMLLIPQKVLFIFSGGLIFGLIFYSRTWMGLVWFCTNSYLYTLAAGGIDMYVMGSGIILLMIGDKHKDKFWSLFIRLLAYGFLLVKPQGGVFIVAVYAIWRLDWKGILLGCAVYYLPFMNLFPSWLHVILNDPPTSQMVAAQSIACRYGLGLSVILALYVIFSRKWTFWQLGGALAAILPPYGMPGVPLLIIMTAIRPSKKFVFLVLFSGALAYITWVTPLPHVDFYYFVNHMMAVYHLVMIMVALYFACQKTNLPNEDGEINLNEWLRRNVRAITQRLTAH